MMTELEIVSTFRQAKYPGKQVAILAELNGCSTEEIKEILLRNGVEQKNLPRKSRKMRQAEMDALVESSAIEEPVEPAVAEPMPEETPAPVEVQIPDVGIFELICKEEAAAATREKELGDQMRELRVALRAAEKRLADIRMARRALERYFGLVSNSEEQENG